MREKRITAPGHDLQDTADHDGMPVPLDDVLDRAIDRSQRTRQHQCAAFQRAPIRIFIARRALDTALAGEAIRHRLLAGRKNIEAETIVPTDGGPDGSAAIDVHDDGRGSTESAVAEVTVAPVRLSPVPRSRR